MFLRNRKATPSTFALTVASLCAIIAARSSSGALDLHAELGKAMPRLLEHLRGMEQRLRRDAADVQAGAAGGRALLDDGDLQPELRRADGADIAARAGADDDEIVLAMRSASWCSRMTVDSAALAVLRARLAFKQRCEVCAAADLVDAGKVAIAVEAVSSCDRARRQCDVRRGGLIRLRRNPASTDAARFARAASVATDADCRGRRIDRSTPSIPSVQRPPPDYDLASRCLRSARMSTCVAVQSHLLASGCRADLPACGASARARNSESTFSIAHGTTLSRSRRQAAIPTASCAARRQRGNEATPRSRWPNTPTG